MAFPPSFLEELRNRLPVSSVVGRTVRLVRKGREFSGLCPFHNEKTPSFTVNDDKGFFHCFGCGAHGDVIAFAMRAQSLSFPEAIERLAAEAGMEVPVEAPEERERAKRAASLHDASEAACLYFEKMLRSPQGRSGLEYLYRRGLTEETIARFRLGFAPDSRTGLRQALKAAKIDDNLSVEAGLLISPEGGGEPYDRFRGRVMFPITDRRGRVVAFGGRIMGDGQPKYLNSPDTPLFHKGGILYGLAQAREPAAKAGTILVCEGYMDVIALNQAGFAHAVAPLGTALTEQQIELLWRFAPEPVICLDGDAAGQRAAGRAALRALPLLKPGMSLRFAMVPPPEDPDSLIRKEGPDAMRQVVAAAQPLHDVLWNTALAEHPADTPERRAGLKKHLWDLSDLIADRIVHDQYRAAFDERMRDLMRPPRPEYRPAVPYGATGRFGAKGSSRKRTIDRGMDGRLPGAGLPPPIRPPGQVQEALMLLLLVTHPGLLDDVAERLGEMRFADSELDKLRVEVLKHLDMWGSLDSEGARLHLIERGFAQEVLGLTTGGVFERSEGVAPGSSIEAAHKLWEHTYKRYRDKDLSAELRDAEQRLGDDLSEESYSRFDALRNLTNRRAED